MIARDPVENPTSRWKPSMAGEFGLPEGLTNWATPTSCWTTRLLARHAREHGSTEGHPWLAKLAQGTVCKILCAGRRLTGKVGYHFERRDPEFKQEIAKVLLSFEQVGLFKKAKRHSEKKKVAIVSYDEKPGIQAVANTAPDLPPTPGV